jgi:PUA domain protein
MQVKSRHHLRADAIAEIESSLEAALGVELDGDSYEKVEFDDADEALVLVDGEPAVLYVSSVSDGASKASGEAAEPFLTVQGANEYPPSKRTVTVDAGAISFVSDGADVMRPGIVEADEAIAAGELVVITEETHGKALAIGRAQTEGSDMTGDSGKVVTTLHHVGDELFETSI